MTFQLADGQQTAGQCACQRSECRTSRSQSCSHVQVVAAICSSRCHHALALSSASLFKLHRPLYVCHNQGLLQHTVAFHDVSLGTFGIRFSHLTGKDAGNKALQAGMHRSASSRTPRTSRLTHRFSVTDAFAGLWQVSEVGTLSQVFQWRGDSVARTLPNFSQTERGSVSDILSEVSLAALVL